MILHFQIFQCKGSALLVPELTDETMKDFALNFLNYIDDRYKYHTIPDPNGSIGAARSIDWKVGAIHDMREIGSTEDGPGILLETLAVQTFNNDENSDIEKLSLPVFKKDFSEFISDVNVIIPHTVGLGTGFRNPWFARNRSFNFTIPPQKVFVGPCKSRNLSFLLFEKIVTNKYSIDFEVDTDATSVHMPFSSQKLSEYLVLHPEVPFHFDYNKDGISLEVEYKDGKVILKNIPITTRAKKLTIDIRPGPQQPLPCK